MKRLASAQGAFLIALLSTSGACGDDLAPQAADAASPDGPDAGPSEAVELAGHAYNWAGVPGMVGFNGDGHHRLRTVLYWSMDLIFARDGTPWFIDFNNYLVRKVLPDQTVVTVVGWTDPVFPGDGDGSDPSREQSAEGDLGTNVQLNHPTDFALAPDGSILLMAWHNHKLRKIDPATGRVWILSGGGSGFAGDGGPAIDALFKQPKSVDIDEQGNLYILDQQNERIRKIDASTPEGTITTIAGTGIAGYSGDGGPAVDAQFAFEAGSNPEPSGGMAYANRKLYVADGLNNRIRVIDLDTGIVDLVAGTGVKGYAGDGGPALEAELNNPKDLEIGPEGDLYVADTDNNRIRAIDLAAGTIRTIAGTGQLGLDDGDGKPAVETKLKRPFGIQFDPSGNLYIMDTVNSRILRVPR